MKIINVLNKKTADTLSSLGFRYFESELSGKKVYQFIKSDELVEELASNFEQDSFFISKYFNF